MGSFRRTAVLVTILLVWWSGEAQYEGAEDKAFLSTIPNLKEADCQERRNSSIVLQRHCYRASSKEISGADAKFCGSPEHCFSPHMKEDVFKAECAGVRKFTQVASGLKFEHSPDVDNVVNSAMEIVHLVFPGSSHLSQLRTVLHGSNFSETLISKLQTGVSKHFQVHMLQQKIDRTESLVQKSEESYLGVSHAVSGNDDDSKDSVALEAQECNDNPCCDGNEGDSDKRNTYSSQAHGSGSSASSIDGQRQGVNLASTSGSQGGGVGGDGDDPKRPTNDTKTSCSNDGGTGSRKNRDKKRKVNQPESDQGLPKDGGTEKQKLQATDSHKGQHTERMLPQILPSWISGSTATTTNDEVVEDIGFSGDGVEADLQDRESQFDPALQVEPHPIAEGHSRSHDIQDVPPPLPYSVNKVRSSSTDPHRTSSRPLNEAYEDQSLADNTHGESPKTSQLHSRQVVSDGLPDGYKPSLPPERGRLRQDRTFDHYAGGHGRRLWQCQDCSMNHLIDGTPEHLCNLCGRFYCLDHWDRHPCHQRWFVHHGEPGFPDDGDQGMDDLDPEDEVEGGEDLQGPGPDQDDNEHNPEDHPETCGCDACTHRRASSN